MQDANLQLAVGKLAKALFPMFKDVYLSEEEMRNYFLEFMRIFENHDKAYFEFMNITQCYCLMKRTKDDVIKLVAMTSIIEKLSSDKDYVAFPEWVKRKESEFLLQKVQKLTWKAVGFPNRYILKIWNKYNEEFGCSGRFIRFFQNPEYVSKEEQLSLLRTICFNKSGTSVSLFCFDENSCRPAKGGCLFGKGENCPAFQEEKILKNGIKEFANFLYDLRSKFVHDANLFGLSEHYNEFTFMPATYVHYKFRYHKRPPYNGVICLGLSRANLEQIIERNFKKLLDKYIVSRKKQTES